MKKNIYCIIDTETAGGLFAPLCYDIALIIFDRSGHEYTRKNWLVREVWNDAEKMNSAYYAWKRPLYDTIPAMLVNAIRFAEDFTSTLAEFGVTHILAYNLKFDLRAISNTTKTFISGYIFNPSIKNLDIWGMACELLLNTAKYRKTAEENGWMTDKGNFKTSAEVAYRYLTGENDFDESHTALDDCDIEKVIFLTCLNKKKKFSGGIIANPWKLVQTSEPAQLSLSLS